MPQEDSSNTNESLNSAENGTPPARHFVGHANSHSTDPTNNNPAFPISVHTHAVEASPHAAHTHEMPQTDSGTVSDPALVPDQEPETSHDPNYTPFTASRAGMSPTDGIVAQGDATTVETMTVDINEIQTPSGQEAPSRIIPEYASYWGRGPESFVAPTAAPAPQTSVSEMPGPNIPGDPGQIPMQMPGYDAVYQGSVETVASDPYAQYPSVLPLEDSPNTPYQETYGSQPPLYPQDDPNAISQYNISYAPTWVPDLDAIDQQAIFEQAQINGQIYGGNNHGNTGQTNTWVVDGSTIPPNHLSDPQTLSQMSTGANPGSMTGAPPYVPPPSTAHPEFLTTPIFVPTPTGGGYARAKRKGHPAVIAGLGIVIAIIVLAVVFFLLSPFNRFITLNGDEMEVKAHTTLQELVSPLENRYVAGDLLAIDGSLLTKGGGEKYSVTLNGNKATNLDIEVSNGDVILVSNGEDTTEDYTEETVEVFPNVEIEGVGAMHLFEGIGTKGTATQRTGLISGIVEQIIETEPMTEKMLKFNVDSGDDKVIALTFDDGPWEGSTDEILDILAANDASATFFTIGNQVEKHASSVKRAVQEGHQVETHTWDHASGSGQGVNLGYMTEEEQRDEIAKGIAVIEEVTGADAGNVMRVPGGNLNEVTARIISEFSIAEIGWNIDTEDWSKPGVQSIVDSLLSVSPGNIVLMHDGGGDRSQTVEALRQALPILRERGYRFVTINQLIDLYAADQAAAETSQE